MHLGNRSNRFDSRPDSVDPDSVDPDFADSARFDSCPGFDPGSDFRYSDFPQTVAGFREFFMN